MSCPEGDALLRWEGGDLSADSLAACLQIWAKKKEKEGGDAYREKGEATEETAMNGGREEEEGDRKMSGQPFYRIICLENLSFLKHTQDIHLFAYIFGSLKWLYNVRIRYFFAQITCLSAASKGGINSEITK